MPSRNLLYAAQIVVALVCSFGVRAAARADAPGYATTIAPIFRKYCNGCHNGEDREGQLVLEAYPRILEGGKHGAAIVPRDSADSLLIRVLTGKAKPAMPPKDEAKPTAEEIAAIAAWIDAGAADPQGVAPDPTILAVPKIAVLGKVVDPLDALACSPNGDVLAAARYGAVELLRSDDRSLLRRLEGHRGRVTCVRFSADGSRLVAAAGEPGIVGEARLWNVADGSLVNVFRGHRDSLYSAALSPDGKILATGSYDQQIKLWDTATGAELRTLSGHNDAVYDLAFRPDGRVLASVSGDRTAKLWDVASGARMDTLSQSLKELYAVAFSPDGTRLAAGGVDNRIRVWNISPTAQENSNPLAASCFAHEGAILKLVFSRDGHTLVSAAEDNAIKIWDADTMELRGALERQPDWPAGLTLSPDARTLFVGRLDGSQATYPLEDVAASGATAAPLSDHADVVVYLDPLPIDKLPRIAEVEPNDSPEHATPINVPCVATGRIQAGPAAAAGSANANSASPAPSDADMFRFEAKAGDRWILEINAARSGSALDSRIEVLAADGRRLERLWLRAERDSELEFRSEDSSDRGLRLSNWEEIELDDLVYLEGEVIKQYRQRRGPDSDADFYPESGSRQTFFDTSPRTHALGVKAYVVAPYPAGAKLPYNGLPVFPVYYDNDDDGRRKLGVDSRLVFTAPADGVYLARVTDVRGFGGEKFDYQLVVRRPRPDFGLSVGERNLTIPAGSGKPLALTVDRQDDFWGEVRVDISGLPRGFHATSPIVIEAGQTTARGVLFAHPWAPSPSEADWRDVKIVGTALIGGHEVAREANSLGKVQLGLKPQAIARLSLVGQEPRAPTGDVDGELAFPTPADLTIAPGGTVACRISVERNGFDGIINFDADNLPHGVIVDDIGLSGIELLEGQTERIVQLSASRIVPEQDRPFQMLAKEAGVQVSLPLMLHVRKASAAKTEEAAPKAEGP